MNKDTATESAKARLIEILETASKVMWEDTPATELCMESYVEATSQREEVLNPCGYPACVLGHIALQSAIKEPLTIGEVQNRASNLAGELDDLGIALMGSTAIGDSVYEATTYQRAQAANETRFFTLAELDTFAHLDSEYPTGQDAHIYIEALLKHVRAL